jgi:hypothetical protein
VTRNATGRPTKLTPRTEDAILHAITEGHSVVTACHNAGVTDRVFFMWMRRGEAADQHAETLEDDEELPESELPFLRFFRSVLDARAQAEQRAIKAVNRQMEGGALISEKPLLDINGQPVRGDNGLILYERTWSQPDGRLAMQYLSKLSPKQWGREPVSIDVQMSGSLSAGQSGPVAVSEAEVVNLATRVAGVIAAREAEADDFDADEDIVDADVVEDADLEADDPRRSA